MLRVAGLSKRFEIPGGHVGAVRDLDLNVAESEFFVLLGPSGCGKTTLMRCIAGLEQPEGGEVWLGDTLLSATDRRLFVDPEDRGIAMVFQSYAIWPHLTVFENVAFPLTEAKRGRLTVSQAAPRVRKALALVRLASFERHSAATLSGGQAQRVALARALVREPKLLLMDEPLSNLDAQLREEMRDEIKELTRTLGVTTIHVTHDQVEAMALADRLAVMHEGRILEIGAPEALYSQPGSRIVAEFLGRTNWVDATVRSADSVEGAVGVLRCNVPPALPTGSRVSLGIRPDWVALREQAEGTVNTLDGWIESRMFLGDTCHYRVRTGEVVWLVKAGGSFAAQRPIHLVLPPEKCLLYPASEDEATTVEAVRGQFGAATAMREPPVPAQPI